MVQNHKLELAKFSLYLAFPVFVWFYVTRPSNLDLSQKVSAFVLYQWNSNFLRLGCCHQCWNGERKVTYNRNKKIEGRWKKLNHFIFYAMVNVLVNIKIKNMIWFEHILYTSITREFLASLDCKINFHVRAHLWNIYFQTIHHCLFACLFGERLSVEGLL